MKKFLIVGLIAASLLQAVIVDRVVASVNGEPITSYDIAKTVNILKTTPQQALNYLIDKKILDSEIKKRGIGVDEFDIENAVEKIAQKNGMTLFEFKSYLQQRGELEKLRSQIKNDLLKEKLFSQIVNSKLKISDKEINDYYTKHQQEFKTFNTIEVVSYYSNNPQKLEEIKKNPFISNNDVLTKTEIFKYSEMPLNLLYLFNKTKEGEFTPVINNGASYITYYIAKKEGETLLPLESVKNIIINKIVNEKRERILKEYFAKIKNQADIKIYKD